MPIHIVLLWWQSAAVLIVLFLLTAAVSFVDTRRLGEDGVWAKPMKFQLSLALHFATLAAVTSALSEPWQSNALVVYTGAASVAATIFEVGYIMLQAARQQESHFNLSTPLLQFLYALMAIGAVIITVAAAAVGLAVAMDPGSALGPAARTGSATGLIGGTILTLVIAFRMGGALSRHVGVAPPDAPRMPLTGWSLAVGDRRVPHFFATHLMQAGPLAGLAADALLPPGPAIACALAVCAAWTALTAVLFVQANRGLPVTALSSRLAVGRIGKV